MAQFNATHKPINLDHGGWHIWHGAGKHKVFANGPDETNWHLEFTDSDDAINWFYMTGQKELARALHAHVKRLIGES